MSETVLITGSSSGIGSETAVFFAQNGFNVIINGLRNHAGLAATSARVTSCGVKCLSFLTDISDFASVDNIFRESKKHGMVPDIIINNAGISHIGLLQDMTPDDWQRVINTNLTSAFNTAKCAIPYMLSKGGGTIVNISSMWGCVGASCEAAYSASKGGLNAFTRALAKELAPSGIQVNAVAFGTVDTTMNAFLNDEEKADLKEQIPAGRFCSAQEAASIIYRVSQLDNYVTGQIITADGGFT